MNALLSLASQRGWDFLRQLKHSQQAPQPQHALADPEQRDTCKKVRPMLCAVAHSFPHAQVQLWATDEHCIYLKPLLCRVWASIEQRPVTIV